MTDKGNAYAGFLRGARPGRKDDALGFQVFDLLDGQLVVTGDGHIGAQFTHVLHQVVGEGIVVVEDKDHGRQLFQCSATPAWWTSQWRRAEAIVGLRPKSNLRKR